MSDTSDDFKDLSMTCPACGARIIPGRLVHPDCERYPKDDMLSIPAAAGWGFVLAAGTLGYLVDSTLGLFIGTGMGAIALTLVRRRPVES